MRPFYFCHSQVLGTDGFPGLYGLWNSTRARSSSSHLPSLPCSAGAETSTPATAVLRWGNKCRLSSPRPGDPPRPPMTPQKDTGGPAGRRPWMLRRDREGRSPPALLPITPGRLSPERWGRGKMRGQERGGRRPPCCRGAEEGGQETRGEAREEKVKSERKENENRGREA